MQSSRVIASLFLAAQLVASVAMAAPVAAPDEVELRQLSNRWMTAIEKKDKQVLESLLADDFVLQMPGDSEPQYVHRAEWLGNAINMNWSNFRYENMAVKVNGDQAIVTSKLFFRVSPNPLMFDSGVVDTWDRRAGKWQVTRRYLGESALKTRLSFVFGMLAAGLVMAAVYLLMRLSRRLRKRSA